MRRPSSTRCAVPATGSRRRAEAIAGRRPGLRLRLSVTARLTLLAVALALVTNLVLVSAIWKQTHDQALDVVRRETVAEANALAAEWRSGGERALDAAIEGARSGAEQGLMIALLDERGRRVAGWTPRRVGVPLEEAGFEVADIDASPAVREAGYAMRHLGGRWLLVARSLDLLRAEQVAIERALGIAVVLSMALGLLAGVVLARYVARRLDAVVDVIDAAGQGDLSLRVATPTTPDDAFDRLAERLNAMLARVEGLVGELRVVTDSVAHDLRSPLARLRTKTEAAVTATDAATREMALAGLLGETDLVMRMLTMLVEISRSEAGSRERFAALDLAELIDTLAELYAPVVEEAGLAFATVVEPPLPPMRGHRELLTQAIANLIDNALRHAGSGAALTIRVRRLGGSIGIAVEDRGPGIAEADRPRALARFGRLDAARSSPGAGLGMALVQAVAKLHGGRLELADNGPGLIARIVVPAD